jgi:carbonic anhydrase
MSTVDDLKARNTRFAREAFTPKVSLIPALKTIVISCVDSRVEPAHVLGLGDGDAVVIRNIGGRVTPAAIETPAMLGAIARDAGTPPGAGWNLIVLQHTGRPYSVWPFYSVLFRLALFRHGYRSDGRGQLLRGGLH